MRIDCHDNNGEYETLSVIERLSIDSNKFQTSTRKEEDTPVAITDAATAADAQSTSDNKSPNDENPQPETPNNQEQQGDENANTFATPSNQRHPIISQVLKNALYSGKDRMFILSLEQDLISFINSNVDSYLLRPMNSYYRLLTHQTAEYYALGHSLHNDGISILVFKNFGVDITLPVLLASVPYDYSIPLQSLHPQFHAAHIQHQQQFFPAATPGFIPSHSGSPNAPGATPFGFVSPQQFGFPVPPQGSFQPYSPQFQGLPNTSEQISQPTSAGLVSKRTSISSPNEPTKKESSVPATPSSATSQTQFKLMKRTSDEANTSTKDETKPEEKPKESEQDDEKKTTEESTEGPVALESERASRETLYQRARERIFQDEEDEEDEEEPIEVKSNQNSASVSPDIPRVIPQQFTPQFQYPQGVPMAGVPPQPFYYPITSYPQGVTPQGIPQFPTIGNENLPSSQGYIPGQYYYAPGASPQQQHHQHHHHQNHHHQHQSYRKQRNYNNNGYRKNYNNYNNNHGTYSNGPGYGNDRGQRSTENLSNELNGKLRIDDQESKNEKDN